MTAPASERKPQRAAAGSLLSPSQLSLLALNAAGGLAVLGSYAWGVLARPEAMSALWGGVPESARSLYTVNMFLAAAGYFLFTPYIVFRLVPGATRAARRPGAALFHAFYALVLLFSALWLPLTARMLDEPSIALWWVIRLDLFLVALGSLGLLVSLSTLRGPVPRGRGLALLGLLPFCLQTAVLDALVWPAYFPLPPH